MRNKFFYSTVFTFLLSVFVFGQSYQDWKWQHPTPQGNTLRWVKRFDASTWYGVGFAGTFTKTTDGGATFFVQHKVGRRSVALQHATLYDAHFFNKETGVAVGSLGTIARTTNGGVTFDTIAANPLTTSPTLYQVYFVDNSLGYAVGTSGTLIKTTDAGVTWSTLASGVTTSLYDVWSPDGNLIVVATTSGNTRRSTDGGATWTAINSAGSGTINRMVFTTNTNGYIAGASNYFRYTTDAGLTWVAPTTAIPATVSLYDIDNIGSTVYLTGHSYYIFKTSDNGTTWDTLGFLAPVAQQPWTSTYYATDFGATQDTLLTGGSFGLLNHATGMNQRTAYTRLVKPGTINDVWVSQDNQKIITVGAPTVAGSAFDQILISTNGGSTWGFPTVHKRSNSIPPNYALFVPEIEQTENSKENPAEVTNSTAVLNSIFMLNDQVGFAVGSNSAVYKTTNGGLVWDSLATTIAAGMNLSRVFFVNANTGWVISKTARDVGTIWKTTNGGETWTEQSIGNALTGSSTQLYGIQMLTENVGWVLNYTPKPFKTTDGGTTWTPQTLVDGFGGFLYDIKMFDENNGFLVGSSGRVYKTTNSGANWDTVTIPTRSYSLYKVTFLNANKGFISGGTGTIFSTTDAGATWSLENTSGATLNSIVAAGTSTMNLYTVGSNGYIFKRTLDSTPASITVTAPNGGENYNGGSTQSITWNATGVTNVKIEFSSDNGTNWSTVVASVAATPSSYSTQIPNISATQCLIKISDVSNSAVFDVSNAVFSITAQQAQTSVSTAVNTGWNMAAVSVIPPSFAASALFSGSDASVFGFNNGYVAQTTLENGKGYWVRYPAPTTVTHSGNYVTSTTVLVSAGWNMIGVYGDTVVAANITTTPPGIINSNYFGFNNGYSHATKLAPGRGYWVRTTQAGSLILVITAKNGAGEVQPVSYNGKIIVTDASGKTGVLYNARNSSDLVSADLPPVPPAGLFDVRFTTQKEAAVLGAETSTIQISGAQYPVTIRTEGLTLSIKDKVTGGKVLNSTVSDGQAIVLSNPAVTALEIASDVRPAEFELTQNYPNPFNPSTNISFSLPERTNVTLTVYNQLGQKVATLFNGVKESGRHTVEFNASQLSSGVYFYELKTEKNSAIKKLMLMK